MYNARIIHLYIYTHGQSIFAYPRRREKITIEVHPCASKRADKKKKVRGNDAQRQQQ